MKEIIKTVIIIILLIIFIVLTISSTSVSRKDFPYIENNVLYTETKSIPIKFIKRVDLIEESVRFFIVTYEYDKYNGGMITMSYRDFKKIEIQLLGDTYDNRAEEARKKAQKSQNFFSKIFGGNRS